MKLTSIIICFLLIGTAAYSQVIEELKYCNCLDKIESLSPIPNGKYERTCAGKVIETGIFKEGKKDGLWTTYSASGKIIRKISYKDGALDGSIELFYLNGKPKLTASFVNNQRNGSWTYYSTKGKVRINGEYAMNKPVNVWTIKDAEGKNTRIQYDFNTSTYLKNEAVSYHQSWDVVENDNNGEFFIILYPERTNSSGTAPLGGFLFANDLFVDLMEIPMDFWDTYTNKTFVVNISITSNHASIFSLAETDETLDDVPEFIFLAKTNDSDKLHKVEHSELSGLLLISKVNETLLFMPPWIYKEAGEIQLQIPYVINDIKGIEKFEK